MATPRRIFTRDQVLELHREVLDLYAELDPPDVIGPNVFQSLTTMCGQFEIQQSSLGLPAMAIPGGRPH